MQFKVLTLLAMASLNSLALSSYAADVPMGPHITVSGEGSIETSPNMASIEINVRATDKQVETAKSTVDQRVAAYMDFLNKQQVDPKDINAANLQTYPEYDYTKKGEGILKGYVATRQIKVNLMNLDKLNTFLDGAIKAGLNDMKIESFGVADPSSYQAQAQQKAIQNAIDNATILAKGFGAQLGTVYSINYQKSDNSRPMPLLRMATLNANQEEIDNTYKPQNMTFTDRVDAVFNLKP